MALTISRRLGLLVALAVAACVGTTAFQLGNLRQALLEERRVAIASQVEAAQAIVKVIAADASQGKFSEAEAKERAKQAIRSIRFGKGEYVVIYNYDGTILVHRVPKLEGQQRLSAKDANGVMFTHESIEAAKRGGGFVSYAYPREGNPDPSPKISYSLPFAPWNWAIAAGVYVDDIDSTFWSEVRLSAIVELGILATLTGLAWLLARGFIRPLRGLTASMKRLAAGDLAVEVEGQDRGDDVAPMARAVQVFKENGLRARALETEAAETRARIERDRLDVEAERGRTASEQAGVVAALGQALAHLAQGDLTGRLSAFPGDYLSLQRDFNAALETLEDTMAVIAGNGRGIRSGSSEISEAASDLSRRTEQQAASLEETAAAMDEITATVRRTAEGAEHANRVVTAAQSDAEESERVVKDAIVAMGAIERSSGEISSIIGVIDEIAFQTNLLALNAGVEAARAGEAGRGFAVVASEVRALAQRSAEAAKEIKALISTSSSQVASGVTLVGETGKALNRILTQVGEISGIVTGIAAAAQEQAAGLSQVNTAVNQMDRMTQQNAAMVEESTAASRALAIEADQLSGLIGRFRTGHDDAAPRRAVAA